MIEAQGLVYSRHPSLANADIYLKHAIVDNEKCKVRREHYNTLMCFW